MGIASIVFLAVLAGELASPIQQGLSPAAQTSTLEWELVRTVPNEQGTMDLVVVPEQRKADRAHYEAVAKAVCGSRRRCMVHFWTDRSQVPTSAWMPVESLRVMTADYERSPSYEAPVLRLACWLYATKAEAEKAKCFYMPGVKVPWEK